MASNVAYVTLISLCLFVSDLNYCEGLLCPEIHEDISQYGSNITFRLYKRQAEQSEFTDVPYDRVTTILDSIDRNAGFVMYAHGYQENANSDSIQVIVKAHLQRGEDNLVILDWGKLGGDDYDAVACRIPEVGRTVSKAIDKLIESGLDLQKTHIAGHSLGAQVIGFAGRYSKVLLPRITGIDPAKPGFYQRVGDCIMASDAKFVDIIHSDDGFYGPPIGSGTVDFYANNGSRPQPGCPFSDVALSPGDLCSHRRAVRIYAESVVNSTAFVAVKCPTYENFSTGQCNGNERAYVGYSAPTNISGVYYFEVGELPALTNDGLNDASHSLHKLSNNK